MGRLYLVFFFLMMLLLENIFTDNLILWRAAPGLEIRLSLVLKGVALLANILILTLYRKQHSIPVSFLVLSLFLLLSTLSVWLISPGYFVGALSVMLHLQLMLNLGLFVYLHAKDTADVTSLLRMVRWFAVVNAIFVLLSFFYSQYSDIFEVSQSPTGVKRAFGLMGDEVSLFLTYFLFEALIRKNILLFWLFFTAILCTAGIAAFIVAIALVVYYIFVLMPKTLTHIYLVICICLAFLGPLFLYKGDIPSLGVISRIEANWKGGTRESSGLRLVSLGTALDMVKKKPLLGTGFGAYAPTVRSHFAPLFVMEGLQHRFEGTMVIVASAFNTYLQFVCEAGLIGLAVFLFFLYSLYRIFSDPTALQHTEWRQVTQINRGWFVVFCLSSQSVNWFLPSSFLLLLIMVITGIQLKVNQSLRSGPVVQMQQAKI